MRRPAAFLLTLLWAGTNLVCAGDWPQILGPARNGIAAADEKLLTHWPAGGPRVLWERPVGHGDAGVAIVGQRGILFHRLDDEEVTEAFDVTTGKTLWKDAHPTTFAPQVGDNDGPLCVPVVAGERVITFGAQGVLTCCELTTGRRLWQQNTHREFAAVEGYFGAGSTPLVLGDRVIVNVGGSRERAGIVAFSLESGEVLWKQTDEPASYSAPVSVDLQGTQFIVMVTRYKCLLLEPTRGTVMFQFPFGQRGPTVNGASPVVSGKRLLITSSYGQGSVYGEIEVTGFNRLFAGEKPLATQYCTPILLDGKYYVIDGRDDLPPADLKCIEFDKVAKSAAPVGNGAPDAIKPPGKTSSPVLWIEQSFGYGTLLAADGKLLAAKTDGELVLLRPNPDRCEVLDRAQVVRRTLRALPALAHGQLYVRDDRVLKCLQIGVSR